MKTLRRLIGTNRSGAALIEFAITLPILIIMLIGTLETARYAILVQKLDKAAAAMADFVTQRTSVSVTNLNSYSSAIDEIMQPFGFSGTVVFTSIASFNNITAPCTDNNVNCVTWQYTTLGSDGSKMGAPGTTTTLPANYMVPNGQNVVTAEIFYNYQPMLAPSINFLPAFSPHQIYKVSLYKPRQGTLTTLDPN